MESHSILLDTEQISLLQRPIFVVKTTPRPVLRGSVADLNAGALKVAYVKLSDPTVDCIERVCSWLGRKLELPLPQPLVARVFRSKVPIDIDWPYQEPYVTLFGTLEVQGAQPVRRFESDVVVGLLRKWPGLVMGAVFDQLVANDDRSSGNLLVGPDRRLWLIDHNRCLGSGLKLFSDAVPPAHNLFLQELCAMSPRDRVNVRGAVIEACADARYAIARVPYRELGVPNDVAVHIQGYLERRGEVIQDEILRAIGVPELQHLTNVPSSRFLQ